MSGQIPIDVAAELDELLRRIALATGIPVDELGAPPEVEEISPRLKRKRAARGAPRPPDGGRDR